MAFVNKPQNFNLSLSPKPFRFGGFGLWGGGGALINLAETGWFQGFFFALLPEKLRFSAFSGPALRVQGLSCAKILLPQTSAQNGPDGSAQKNFSLSPNPLS